MFLTIVSIVEAFSYGVIGYLAKDAVQVANYILSPENLNSEDPLIFSNGNKINESSYISDLVDICANGNGNFTNVIKGGKDLNSNLDQWKQNRNLFAQRRNSITCDNGDDLKNY